MTRRLRMGVMVVMPALTKGQQRHPEAVFGSIASGKPPRSPHVSGRVHQPGGVKPHDGAEENAPQQEPPATCSKKNQTQHSDGDPMPLADPNMESVFAKFRNVREKVRRIVVHGLTREEPTYVSPKPAVARRVGVPFV